MEAEANSVVGQVIDDRYRIERKVGAGGMGDVYVARQLNVDRLIALKLLKPERARDERAVEQFLTEATAVSRLNSPHTVTLHDVGQLADGAPYIAMELLDGQTLRSRMVQGPLELEEILSIIDGIALSLAEAHARSVIHRDLKPNNVFLARTPGHGAHVKVLDFGLARLIDTDQDEIRAAGTPPYMAPETLRGTTVDARTDVYALAMVAYELLAGRHPFDDRTGAALIEAQLTEVPPPLDDVSEHDLSAATVDLVARGLAKPPRLRPADAGAFRDAWRASFGLARDRSEPARSVTAVSQHKTRPSQTVVSMTLPEARVPSRQTRSLAAGTLIVAGLAAATAWLAWPSQTGWDPPPTGAAVASTAPPLVGVAEPPATATRPSADVGAAPTTAGVPSTHELPPEAPPPPLAERRPTAPPSRPSWSRAQPKPSPSVPPVEQRIRDYLDD